MDTLDTLWNEWIRQTLLVQANEAEAFRVLQAMVDAVLHMEVSDPDEINEILLELVVFGEHYPPAKEWLQEVCERILQGDPSPFLEQSDIAQAILREYKETRS